MNLSDFDFDLPESLIAQKPLENRDASRMMVYDREKKSISHRLFRDISTFLKSGDCLVLNNTRVIPARLNGEKEATKAAIEILLLEQLEADVWEVLVKPGKKALIGTKIKFNQGLCGEIIDIIPEHGSRIIKFLYEGNWEEILMGAGVMPLPPYIHEVLHEPNRYQTIYSKINGSVAAPTAGLHFTESILRELIQKGVNIAYLTLHVGVGTFRPVKTENILEHKMHSEWYEVNEEAAEIINRTKKRNGRIIAVGTTSVRTLETVSDAKGHIQPQTGKTDIFIYPGYHFKVIDGLVTNFHLPKSTLLMLVSAFLGKEEVLKLYQHAVNEQYRFFSFGDAMLIL